MYGTETWAPTKAESDLLEGKYIEHLRLMMGLTTFVVEPSAGETQFITPAKWEVLSKMGDPPSIEELLETARLRLLGRITRAGPYSVLGIWAFLSPETAERHRGPARLTWDAMVFKDLRNRNLDTKDCFCKAHWKKVTDYIHRGPTLDLI